MIERITTQLILPLQKVKGFVTTQLRKGTGQFSAPGDLIGIGRRLGIKTGVLEYEDFFAQYARADLPIDQITENLSTYFFGFTYHLMRGPWQTPIAILQDDLHHVPHEGNFTNLRVTTLAHSRYEPPHTYTVPSQHTFYEFFRGYDMSIEYPGKTIDVPLYLPYEAEPGEHLNSDIYHQAIFATHRLVAALLAKAVPPETIRAILTDSSNRKTFTEINVEPLVQLSRYAELKPILTRHLNNAPLRSVSIAPDSPFVP